MLYVTDLSGRESSVRAVEKLLPLQNKVFTQVVFALPPSSIGWSKDLPEWNVPLKTKALEHFSYRDIVAAAETEHVSLVVVDLDKGSHLSTLKRLATEAPFPVLVLDREKSSSDLLDHVIFANDWSLASEKAMDLILSMRDLIHEMEIVHVISEKLTVKDMRELKEKLERSRKICLDGGIDAESHVYAGEVIEEIFTASEDYRGSIIIVGVDSRGTLFKRMSRKSRVAALIKGAELPVLFVPFAGKGA